MTQEPTRASEIGAPELDEETIRQNEMKAAVNRRLTRRDALRSMGAIGPSTENLAAKLEEGLGKRDTDIMADFRKANGQ